MQDTTTFRFCLQRCIRECKCFVSAIREQRISHVNNAFEPMLPFFERLFAYPEMKERLPLLLEEFNQFMDAYEVQDYVLAADFLEEGMLRELVSFASEYVMTLEQPTLDERYKENYQIEYTASGMTTMAKKCDGRFRYLHTNECPLEEAWLFADRWRQNGISEYIMAGLGMGYQTVHLYTNVCAKVTIYEEDKNVIELALEYSDIPIFLTQSPNIHIIHDPGYQKFAKAAALAEADCTKKVCLYYPSIQTIQSQSLRENMKNLFIQLDNADRWLDSMLYHFQYNTTHINKSERELREQFQNRTVYLVAGGPSLDKNISLLKNRQDGELVFTVGTSFKRCLEEQVHPDFAIITDPKPPVHYQITDIKDDSAKLILLSTAFAWVSRDYHGEQYLICQKGFLPAEDYAKEHGWQTFSTGGSVTTTALDLCIRLQAKKVVFVGLDLAYTGGRSHQGIKTANMTGNGELMVQDIEGNQVPTSKNLNLYREWIERRIEESVEAQDGIEFIDASEGGAYVEGTKIQKLRDVIMAR